MDAYALTLNVEHQARRACRPLHFSLAIVSGLSSGVLWLSDRS